MKITKLGNGRWRIDGYAKGKRIRQLFEIRERAEISARQMEMESFHHRHGIKELDAHQLAVAAKVFSLLPEGADLIDICHQWLARRKISNECEFEHAIFLFRSDLIRRNKRQRYIDALHKTLTKFMRHFGDPARTRLLSNFSRIDVHQFLNSAIKQTPINRSNHIRDLSVFFAWAKKEEMISENPVESIERPTVDRKEVECLSFAQCQAMLSNTQGADRAYAAIGMFAGIRPEEICRMNWSMVDLDHSRIRIPATITKTRVGRTIELEPNAVAWLRTVYQEGEPVFAGDSSCLIGRLKLAARMERWPQDVLRHTYCSYHVTKFQDAARTALFLHSREGTESLYRHYFKDQLIEDATKFWALCP